MSLLPDEQRRRLLDDLSDDEADDLEHDWRFWARADQLPPPGDWRTWLILAGRGWGKTRTGAEWVRAEVEAGRRGRLALIGATAADVRDVMIEGESGIMATARPSFRPVYEPSKRRVTWPNGAIATAYSADEPDRLRGPQHDGAWPDELAAWRYPEALDMLMFGLRLGPDPRSVVTTTPRPTKLIRELIAASTTAVTTGSTYDNLENLAPAFAEQIIRKYEGTRLGRQELLAEILTDVPGALWTYAMLEDRRPAPDCSRIVVAIDPSGGSDSENDAQGIGVAGLGVDDRGYVLADRTCKLSPDGWGRRAVQAYIDHAADLIVYEKNFGGDMVEAVIQTAARAMRVVVKTKAVVASRGKRVRAEPVAALYEQQRVSHCEVFPELEEELTTWTPESGTSPNRMDWLVWALTELMIPTEAPSLGLVAQGRARDSRLSR
jgi:phage terminase large subunit-like protein